MKKTLFSFAAFVVAMCATFVAGAQTSDKPLLTIGCLSDLHNQLGLINGSADNVRLRGTIVNTLNAMKEQENIDMLILGGDYTSDCTIPEENWARVRDLIHDATQKTFPVGSNYFPVLYCTGNHDYEVANFDNLPKPYNAARYYDFVMKKDLGELDSDECYFEDAPNGNLGTMKVLAAYHYLINGFDFVVLNCGKHYFKSAWDYNYSNESVQWVADKLDEIYAKSPEKTVFFIAHLPFPDSNSISKSNKGMSNSTMLKKTLARHPNVIFLYGHDHGSDNAYIRTKTSQRVTRYNAYGNVISSFDETHVDGLTQGSSPDNGTETSEISDGITSGSYCIRSVGDSGYLSFGYYNAETSADPVACNISGNGGVFNIRLGQTDRYLYCGTNGRFSGNTATFPISLYEVDSRTADAITGHKAASFQLGKQYFITGVKNDVTYAVSCELYSAGSDNQRMLSSVVTLDGENASVPADDNLLWEFSEMPEGDPSFFSAFMGSMRYYNNSIEGNVSVSNSRIVQAMMIYVYSDRIVLQIKNYGESGNISGIQIDKDPEPYTVFRKVAKDDNGTDGINSITADRPKGHDAIYDVHGRRVYNPQKGLYIVNGEKVVY